jgi:serpin B
MRRARFARRCVASLIGLVALAACGGGPASPGSGPKKITALPRTLSGDERALISANNAFAFSLLRRLNATRADSNIFTSPLSASMALGMTMNGTDGVTYDEMRTALGFPASLSRDQVNRSYKDLIALLRGLDEAVDFRIANSIWTRTGFPVFPAFTTLTKDYFDARAETLDFGNPAAIATINGWVNDNTNGKIKTILDRIPSDVVMYLINAIYFKGDWREQFKKDQTRDDRFTTLGGGTVTVKMMNRTGTIRIGGTADAQVIDLPYGGDAFAMTILLPAPGKSVNDLVTSLTPAQWDQLATQLTERDEMPLALPKFTLEWKATLNDELEAMGMRSAFDDADFSRLSPEGRTPGALQISEVVQKTFVDVNEEGTEAAAATSVGIRETSAPLPVRVDRPFIFALRERLSGTIIFIGKIVDPTRK